MTYTDWTSTVPPEITGDPLWTLEAYRLSLFAADLAWPDVCKLAADRRTIGLSDQLYRSVGAISSDIAEGYSRLSHKDLARLYEYALGSAREGRNWYYEGRHVLGQPVESHRLRLLTQVIGLLLTMIPSERACVLKEDVSEYHADNLIFSEDAPVSASDSRTTHHAPRPHA